MEVRQLHTPSENNRWNDFVDESPQGCLFSKTWYLDAIGTTYEIWIVERGTEICAGTVLTKWKGKWTFGPLQKYTGVLFANFEGNAYTIGNAQRGAVKLLLQSIKHLKSFDYFFHPAFTDWLLWYQAGFSETTYYTYRIELEGKTADDLLNLCAPRLRTKIRKTNGDGLIQIKDQIDPQQFYRVNKKTFDRKGSAMPIDHDLFMRVYKALEARNAISLYGITTGAGEYAAVLGVAYDKNCAYLLFSGFDPLQKEAGYTEQLIYHGICKAAARVKVFDFEGSMMPGVESFYRQFGGALTPYFRISRLSALSKAQQISVQTIKGLLGRT